MGHYPGSGTNLGSTEILQSGAKSWRILTNARLPTPRRGLRAGTAQNIIFLFGGDEGDYLGLNNILYFNKTEESWQPAGQMKEPRYYHAVEVIEDVTRLCP